jgi:glycosyltransferase involved in cell wall biosynthesis
VSVPLDPAVSDRVGELGRADLLVGIPSYNNARTIGHVVRAVAIGLAKHFPGLTAAIVNSDGGSRDGTPQVVASTDLGSPHTILARHPLGPVHRILTPYHGVPGKGSALRTIFAIAERLQARACAVVDSDLRSITPGWIELLLGPVVEHGFDYVAPLYLRHKYDGTITNSIVYPLTRSLYGREVRQPIGGEFGFSGRLASHYLSRPVWESDVARFGVDVWMTTTAIADGFRVCESFLGAKIHDPKDPGADLTAMLVQVVAAVFDLMETYHERWAAVDSAESVPLFGFPHGVGLEPVSVNVARMLNIFEQGVRDLREVWGAALEPRVLGEVTALAGTGGAAHRFPDPLWVEVVHGFALAYRRRALPRDQLLRSLVPLYLGRTAAFVLATAASDAAEVEAAIGALADEFVRQKPDLRARWPARAGSQEA